MCVCAPVSFRPNNCCPIYFQFIDAQCVVLKVTVISEWVAVRWCEDLYHNLLYVFNSLIMSTASLSHH